MRNFSLYKNWCLQMKRAFQCMFSLRPEDVTRAKHRDPAYDGLDTLRCKSPSLLYPFMRYNIATSMLLLWILTCTIANYRVVAEEDLEITLSGKQVLELGLQSRLKSAQDVDITLLFKTAQPSGMVFSANGFNGDFLFVEMVRGKLRIILGSKKKSSHVINEEIVIEDDMCDDEWHQLSVKVLEDVTYARVDVSNPHTSRTSKRLKLDKQVVLGGSNGQQYKGLSHSGRNYTGCLSYVVFNNVYVLRRLRKLRKSLDWTCPQKPKIDVINFDQPSCKIHFPNPSSTNLNVALWFRTYHQDGLLITNILRDSLTIDKKAGELTGFVVYFENNVLKLKLNNITVTSMVPDEDIDFGSWHYVRLYANQESISLTFNEQSRIYKFKKRRSRDFGRKVSIGNRIGEIPSFMGWIWNATIDGKTVTYLNGSSIKGVRFRVYRMKDHCYPNVCNNTGRCVQNAKGWFCDCTKTGYAGKTCSERVVVYKRTCAEYYQGGLTKSGEYMIKPGITAFKVYCDMSHKSGPVTRIAYKSMVQRRSVYRSTLSNDRFYYHDIHYVAPVEQITQLIELSEGCQQYVEYYCSKSTLMFSNNKNAALINRYGARWFSREGKIQSYWGGAAKNSFKCACGMNNSCADSRLSCNCDLLDGKWRSDGGFLREKNDLPVTKLQFSRRNTNPAAMYTLGPLECFGNHTEAVARSKSLTSTMRTQTRLIRQSSTNLPITMTSAASVAQPASSATITKPIESTSTTKSSSPTRTILPSPTDSPSTTNTAEAWSSKKYSSTLSKSRISLTSAPEKSFKASTKRGFSDIARNSKNATLITPSTAFAKTGGSLSAEIATTQETITRNSASILVVHHPAQQSESVLTNKQMFILIALISSLALFTILLIVIALRQRIFSNSSKKLTVELKEDAENPGRYAFQLPNNNRGSFSDTSSQSRSMIDMNRIEIVRVSSLYRKPAPSESGSSITSFDASRYLEVGEESDSGSYSSFTKPKSILKGNKFLLSSRPRSEGDEFEMNEPGEVIGLIHVKEQQSRDYDEHSGLIGQSQSDRDDLEFHIGSKTENSDYFSKSDTRHLDCGRLESIDADTGFITDSSLSSNSRKSLSSSGSEDCHDEFYTRKNRKSHNCKRSVRFSLSESKAKSAQSFPQDHIIMYKGSDDEVFS